MRPARRGRRAGKCGGRRRRRVEHDPALEALGLDQRERAVEVQAALGVDGDVVGADGGELPRERQVRVRVQRVRLGVAHAQVVLIRLDGDLPNICPQLFFANSKFCQFFYPLAKNGFLPSLLRNEKFRDEKIAKIERKLTEDRSFQIFQTRKSCIAIHDFRV